MVMFNIYDYSLFEKKIFIYDKPANEIYIKNIVWSEGLVSCIKIKNATCNNHFFHSYSLQLLGHLLHMLTFFRKKIKSLTKRFSHKPVLVNWILRMSVCKDKTVYLFK